MTAFPALIPSTRTYNPGEYPITPHPLLSGSEIRVRHSNTVLGVRLRLTFAAVSSDDVVAVRNHYNGRQGGFLPFAIPDELLSGVAIPADFTPAGHQWVYASRPSVVDVPIAGDTPTNRHDLVVELVTVPPENTIVSGARITVRATLQAGSAQLGAFLGIFASLQAGAASYELGANLEATATLISGEALAVGGVTEITVTASLVAGAASGNAPIDPDLASVSLLLHMDGTNGSTTFTDSSSNAISVTANGNAQISTAQSKFGGASGLFDGSGDYALTASNSALGLGTGDFTIELWARFDSAVDGFGRIVQCGNIGTGGDWQLIRWSTTSPAEIVFDVENSTYRLSSGSSTVPVNTWAHIAVTRAGSTVRMFIDGTQVASGGIPANLTKSVVAVGASDGGANSHSGYIDDLRITKGVARYTSAFTPPSAPFPDS